MRKLLVIPLVGALLFAAVPGAALAGGGWHGGYRGGYGGYYGGHGGWWWPGAVIGGLALGAAAIVTVPFWALSAAPAYVPPPAYAPPVVYTPPPTYAAPPTTYQQAPSYPPPPQAAAVQREVVYPTGRYLLYGDGMRQPWRWVWVPSASPPPPPSPVP